MIDIDLLSPNKLTLSSFSDGEKNIYSKLIELKYEFLYQKDNYILLFDEPDNFLHPNWTKELISILLDNIDIRHEAVHLIITSHSPFILSDLPKDNVVFLQKNDQGITKNVSQEIVLNTFGANIHTLLAHGFFMEEGLMGEFSRNKIKLVIDFLNGKPIKEKMDKGKAWGIIQLIGEPYLKQKLTEQFNEKFLTKDERRIRKIKELEDELKRLKDVKPKS
jgi:ABC-type multidrug transport system ATPase subunit